MTSFGLRTAFLLSWAALLAITALPLPAVAATATTDVPGAQCSEPDELGIQRCRVGLARERMEQLLRTQKESQWCWAASIAMVFAGVGHEVDQESVVRENFGELRDLPAPGRDITRLLNRRWQDREGRAFVASADGTEFGGDIRRATRQVLSELQAGRPLILGAMRHAVVLAQVEFERFTRQDGIRIVGGTVLDPAVGRGIRRMAAYEMKPFYVARVRVEGGEGPARPASLLAATAAVTEPLGAGASR